MADSLAYDTAELVQIVPNLKLSQNFLLDKFFPNIVESDQEQVAIDVDVGKRRMSPFVSPLVEGKLVEQRRIQTNIFRPAYIKDKRAPDLRRPVRRMIGERIGGELTGEERMMANLAFEMADQVDMINRRLEWMAAQVLQTGSVTISGDGFPSVSVNFGRDVGLTISLSGGNVWGASGALTSGIVPTNNLETWAVDVLQASGAVVTDIVFTPLSWQYFKLDPILKQTMWYPGAGGPGNEIQLGGTTVRGAQPKGRWGNWNLWLYNDWYVDDSNAEQPMLTNGTVLMSGADLLGTRAFGMIYDPEFSYQPMPYAPKTWVEKDPAQRIILMQSAPIVIPSRVNACLAATVATS